MNWSLIVILSCIYLPCSLLNVLSCSPSRNFNIIKLAGSKILYYHHNHPYSHALLSAVPFPNPKFRKTKQRVILKGEVPSPRNVPRGCVFHPRCSFKTTICQKEVPQLRPTDPEDPGHLTACHHAENVKQEIWNTNKVTRTTNNLEVQQHESPPVPERPSRKNFNYKRGKPNES